MSKAEQKKLLHEKWPSASESKRRVLIKVIKKASKAKVFDYQPNESEFITSK